MEVGMEEWLTPTWYSTLGSSCVNLCFRLRLIRSISTVVSSNSCSSAWYLLSSMNKYSLRYSSCSTLNGRSKTSHLLRRTTPTIASRVYSRCIVLPVIVSQRERSTAKIKNLDRENRRSPVCVSLSLFLTLSLSLRKKRLLR